MKKLAALLSLFVLCAISASAQTTSVTATVTDPNGIPYKNGTYFVQFSVNPLYPTANYNVGGVPINRGPFSGVLDGTGTFTQVVADNGLTNPKGSSWVFTICNYASNTCFTANVPVTGGSANLSTTLSAAASVITGNATYNTSFSASARGIQIVGAGSQSQDLMDIYDYSGLKLFSVAANGVVFCISGCSGGGGGTPGGTNGQLQWNNGGLFGGLADLTFNGTHTFTFSSSSIINLTAGATLNGLTVGMIPNPLNQNTTGQAGTALALAAAPSTCGAQVASIGISANGNAQCFGSITANFIYAAPNGSAGTPGFRLMVPADVPTLNQSTTGNAATATAAQNTPTLCPTGQAPTGVTTTFNATGCASISGAPAGPTDATQYDSAGAFAAVPSPTSNGFYAYGYNITAGVAAVPSTFLNGFPPRAITGSATTDIVLYSDALNPVVHIHTATGTVNQTLPTATTLGNASFAYHYCNNSPQTDTITPTTWTIQNGNAAGAATLTVPPTTCFRIYVDPTSSTNWLADKTESPTQGGVTSVSGDGALITNSLSSGAVTLTLGLAGAHKYWGNDTGSSTTPAYFQPLFTDLSGSLACGQTPALTGDTTTSAGSCATTTTKINGTAFPTSAVVVGSNGSAQPVAATTTGSGTTVVLATSPSLTTPSLGAATASSILVSGILDGEVPITKTTVASCTLGTASGCNATAYDSGYTFNQDATAAAAITYTLPTAAAGKQYCVANDNNGSAPNTGTIEILTSASGQFILFTDGTYSATGGFVQSGGAAADAACVVGQDSTHWKLYVQSGTWTKH